MYLFSGFDTWLYKRKANSEKQFDSGYIELTNNKPNYLLTIETVYPEKCLIIFHWVDTFRFFYMLFVAEVILRNLY